MNASNKDLFWNNGFLKCENLLDATLLREADEAFTKILERPVVPNVTIMGYSRDTPAENSLIRIENPQLAHSAYKSIMRNRELGTLVANLYDAQVVQIFFAHVTSMPLAGDAPVGIGWHQEEQYPDFIEGSFPTAWIPLRSITSNSGPLTYVPGSHTFGVYPDRGIRSNLTHEQQRADILSAWDIKWSEEQMIGPIGMASIHHSRTLHGTRSNLDEKPRRAMVLHMRTEKNKITHSKNPIYQKYVDSYIGNHEMSPIIFGDSNSLPAQ